MAKTKTVYTCTECGGQSPKWQGQCPHCGVWNTLVETIVGGPAAGAAMAIAAVLSAIGWSSGAFVTLPRLIFALGERGDFPRIFAHVHPRFRTPHVAIVCWAVGSFPGA